MVSDENVYPSVVRGYDEEAPSPDETETATFGLGCFWGPDAMFGGVEGVVRTRVGYAGGEREDPTYNTLGDHTEVVQVEYDPGALGYADVVGMFFGDHDPGRRVRKRQYRNVLLYSDEEELRAVERYLEDEGLDREGIATDIEPLDRFYVAEDYHQKFSLRGTDSLMYVFEELGYSDEEVRESPAAAKLNAMAHGYDLPEGNELSDL